MSLNTPLDQSRLKGRDHFNMIIHWVELHFLKAFIGFLYKLKNSYHIHV